MKALILNNNVVDVVSTEFAVSSDMTWMDCSDDCKAGWTLESGVLTAPPEPPEPTYDDKRRKAYPSIGDQLDMQYHDQLNGTTTWKDAVAKVKSDNPKPE